jgi:hypothetical protein
MPAEAPGTPNLDTRPMPIDQPPSELPPLRRTPRRGRHWLGGLVAVLILGGVAASYLRDRPAGPPVVPSSAPEEKDIPPTLRPYYYRAQTGDASAMRMLGTMYYNGLNVPQNTAEGVRWYRKAAAAGSVAAQKDLEQLGLAPAE